MHTAAFVIKLGNLNQDSPEQTCIELCERVASYSLMAKTGAQFFNFRDGSIVTVVKGIPHSHRNIRAAYDWIVCGAPELAEMVKETFLEQIF